MKRYVRNTQIIILVAAAATMVSGCTKLDENVYSELLASNFQATSQDVPSLIGPVYTNLRGMVAGWQGHFDVQEESADAIVTPARPNGWVDGGTYQRMHLHTWTPTQGQPNGLYSNCYRGINTANRVIFQIESGEIPVPSAKEAVIAELKTARAYYYSILLDNHGNVPIVTDFKDASLPKQSTRQQVYDFTVKELKDNIPLLTETADKTTYGRFTKWAGKAVLARVYLNAEVYTGTPQWNNCMKECDDIINQATSKGTYTLAARYRDNFAITNETCKELIFSVPYDEILATENVIHMKTLDPLMQLVYPMQVQPWGGNCAVPQFIDTYDPDDQRLKDTWIMGPQLNATTGAVVINYVKNVNSLTQSASNEGFRIGKYEIKNGQRGGSSVDFPLFRYADVLMMKAECLLRTNKANEAAAIVTQVRQRNFTANPAKATVTGAQLMQGSVYNYGEWINGAVANPQGGADVVYGRMLDELGWEFAAEAKRRQDIIRFGVFTRKKWFAHTSSDINKIIFPIPQNSLLTNSNLKQNPGY
jgi:hypothetical protein